MLWNWWFYGAPKHIEPAVGSGTTRLTVGSTGDAYRKSAGTGETPLLVGSTGDAYRKSAGTGETPLLVGSTGDAYRKSAGTGETPLLVSSTGEGLAATPVLIAAALGWQLDVAAAITIYSQPGRYAHLALGNERGTTLTLTAERAIRLELLLEGDPPG